MTQDEAKKAAAEAALKEVQDGMVLGLGTGSTARVFVAALIERAQRENLKLLGIPTSEATAKQATEGGIPLTDFARNPTIDITFDGADTVDLKSFTLLKGLGGAMLREKIVAQASRRLVIMIDPSKVAPRFGGIVPVEIVRFGCEATLARLKQIAPLTLRSHKTDSQPYITDGGNYIADLDLSVIDDPQSLQNTIKSIAGVVETGLFIGMAHTIIIGSETGAQVLVRPAA
jgi:ribose 5-phosphate isomerase A